MQKIISLFFVAVIAVMQLAAQPNGANKLKHITTISKADTFSCYFAYCDEIPASFPDGPNGWKHFLEKFMKYPDSAATKMTQGIIRIQLTVETDGSLTDIKALNNPGDGLAEEAVRVIKLSPKWRPATLHGKPVRYSFVQPITFGLP